jgi:8-oxo-dGTP pyrophosphatase MutT (NUDIX family)
LQDLIREYIARFPKETNAIDVLDFFKNSGSIRENDFNGHFTGSAWVLNPFKDRVLMTHHKKLGMWLQLGGHSNGETDLYKVALREAKEESGIQKIIGLSNNIFDLDIHIIPEQIDQPSHKHYDIRFLFEANPKETDIIISEESHDVDWIPLDKVLTFNSEYSIKRMVQKTKLLKADKSILGD